MVLASHFTKVNSVFLGKKPAEVRFLHPSPTLYVFFFPKGTEFHFVRC